MIADAVDRKTKSLNDVGANQVGVSETIGTGHSIGTANGRTKARPLIAGEKENLILQNRSAQRSPKLIALESAGELLTRRGIDGGEIRRRVEQVIAQKLEQIAMNLICA